MQPEVHGTLQVGQVLLILAHLLAGGIGKLGHRVAVDILELDDNVQGFLAGVVGYEGADAEGNPGSVLEVVVELLGVIKVTLPPTVIAAISVEDK